MNGTVIITGANGSIGTEATRYLVNKYPEYTVILTVRDASDVDNNTAKLNEIVWHHPAAGVEIYELDLSKLSSVHSFADEVAANVSDGLYPPIHAIICNAFHWNLVQNPETTEDGCDKTIQVNHIAHVALVLRLIGSFGPKGGRVELLSSDAHRPGRNGTEKFPPGLPDNLDDLLHPAPHRNKQGRGFQIYANSKLAITTWMHAFNTRLLQVCRGAPHTIVTTYC